MLVYWPYQVMILSWTHTVNFLQQWEKEIYWRIIFLESRWWFKKNVDHVEYHLALIWFLVKMESVQDLAVELGKLNMMNWCLWGHTIV